MCGDELLEDDCDVVVVVDDDDDDDDDDSPVEGCDLDGFLDEKDSGEGSFRLLVFACCLGTFLSFCRRIFGKKTRLEISNIKLSDFLSRNWQDLC